MPLCLAAWFTAALTLAGSTLSPVITKTATQIGLASYYAHAFDSQRTASGERFDMHAMTAAHRTLPFGTRVRVTNLANGRSAVVRINDRGPFLKERILDVSYAAARSLHLIGPGVARVRIEELPGEAYAPLFESGQTPGLHKLWQRSRGRLAPVAARTDKTLVRRA